MHSLLSDARVGVCVGRTMCLLPCGFAVGAARLCVGRAMCVLPCGFAFQRKDLVVCSPANWLCEQSEDYTGRVAQVSRKVAARACSKSTMQRYLIRLHVEWPRLGFDERV